MSAVGDGTKLADGFLLHEQGRSRAGAARRSSSAIAQCANVKLEFCNSPAESVAVHAELARGLALIPIILLQDCQDETFLELANGFRIKDTAVVHLQDEGFQLILHV